MEGRVRSARRADTRPFSQILSDGTQEDHDRTSSVASPPRTSRKGRKGAGSGRARAYAEIPEYDNLPKPKQAMNQQHRDRMARKRQLRDRSQASRSPSQGQPRAAIAYAVNAVNLPQQQYPSDSGEETRTCWSFMVRLCRCCAKRLFRRGSTRRAEEDRLRELRLLEEERKVMELQRQFQEIRQRMDRRLEKAATKFEMKERKRAEEKKEQQLLREEVQDKYDNEAAAAGQLSRGLTRQEMKKELKRLQKLERNLSVRLDRLEQRQNMSEPAPWTSSTGDEVVEVMETPPHLLRSSKQKQMTTPREIERSAAMARKRESTSAPWTSSASRPVKGENNSVELGQWELDRLRQHQLELQCQEMEHRLAVEKAVQLNRHKEDMREMERQWKLQDGAKKKKGSEQQLERQRKMAKRAEEELVSLIEQLQNSNVKQQKSDMKTKEYMQITARQQKLCSQNIPREAEAWKVEPPDMVQPEPQRKANGESTTKQQLENTVLSAENKHPMEMQIWLKMQQQLQAMKHKFKMEGNMDAERYEQRWKRMEGEQQREWEKMVLELHRMLTEEKQQQVVWKPHKEQKNIAKEAPTRVDIQTMPEKKEIAIAKEIGEERKLEKVENIRTEAFTQLEIPSKPEKKETMMMEETNEKDIIYEGEQAEETSEEKPVMEKVEPTQGNQITTFTESEESLKHAQFAPEDTPPEIESKVSVKTGVEENRGYGGIEQPKQTMCQKTCGMEWLTEYRQKREQERNGLQSEKTETNNTIMVRPTTRNMARQADADRGSKPDAKQVKSKGMDWLCEIKPEKDLLHTGCQARPVVAGRRQRACEPAAEKAQLEPVVHKDLDDMDWFGDMAVKNRENKRAETNRRHQQSRQKSMLMLQGFTNQPEKKKDENNKGMNVRSRHATTTHADAADEGWLLDEKTPRDTKQSIFSQRSHQKMDWLCESKTQQLMESHSVTAATVVARRRMTQESAIENTDTPKHKELSDDWLGNINKDDKQANINMRHQQNREPSRRELQKKQIDLAEQTAKDNIMVVAPNVRNPVDKKIDAEVNKQEMEWPNTSKEWWSELKRNNQRKLMGNQRKQETFGVHVSKPKEQARELEGQRITSRGLLDNMSCTQSKKTEDTVVEEKTKVSEKAAAMTRLDNSKQSQITGARQTTDRWFGEWMKTKKSAKKLDEVRKEKDRTVLSETRCPPSREENRKRGNVETLVTNVLMVTEVQDSQVTAEKAQSNGRSGLWDNLKGELLIQPCGSRTEASQQLDFGDIALSTTKRKVVSPLQQTTTQQRASSIDIIQNKKFELDDDDGLESITLEEERKPQIWLTKAINTTAKPQRTTNTLDSNQISRVLLNNPTDKQAKEKRQVEHDSHEKEQEKDRQREAHKDEELRSVMKQGETREDNTEDEKSAYCSKSPSVVILSCPSLDADSEKGSVEEKWQQITSAVIAEERVQPAEEEKLLHDDTEDHLGTLEKSPSLVNLLACSSDASGGEEGDGRSETASLAPYETADDVDKSVRRRVLKWLNNKAKDYYSKKIEKTFKREQEEGHELYAPWFSTNILMRSEREQKKRKGLLKAEEMRQRLESSLLKWEAKRAQKRALRMEEAYSLDREPDDLWFCEDLL
ncbi:trichohyalin-like [Engraulis encrasicolus]|uniref:trichohyalin-like n=1 Tax=Engraulis encrasicolus TaxID=184585 RepID=UPI002FCFE4BA